MRRDAEEGAAERQEPLPSSASAWLGFRYQVDKQGNLVSFSRNAGSAVKPFDGDGARAVVALVKQVARLYRHRRLLSAAHRESERSLDDASRVMNELHGDYMAVNQRVDAMMATLAETKVEHGLVGMVCEAPPPANKARLLERVTILHNTINSLADELNFRANFPVGGPNGTTTSHEGSPNTSPNATANGHATGTPSRLGLSSATGTRSERRSTAGSEVSGRSPSRPGSAVGGNRTPSQNASILQDVYGQYQKPKAYNSRPTSSSPLNRNSLANKPPRLPSAAPK